MEEYLEFAKDIAYQAGKIMLKYFNQNNGASYKGDKTIVTLADTEINSYLIKKVKERYPTHAVDGEEEQFGNSDFIWVCDPVDGTAMYARHIPVAVFSLALVIDGVPNIGVVYDPFTDSLYTAIKGKGAYKNGEKISVNNYNLEDIRAFCHCDIAAVKVIVEEAGGKVTDLFGNEQRYDKSIEGALISNGIVHDEVINVIKSFIIKE
ncbi:MAG: inositol monophosphatase family protein [Clostridia bacterium]|nr:inositol monophosphatase family protein [Clostridia bacterium]